MQNEVAVSTETKSRSTSLQNWLIDLLLVLILIGGASLRLVGVNWDQGLHAHPDERFLTMVEAQISPVSSLGEYFDTAQSSLNPANNGYRFFVYGTFPLFLVRYVAEWLNQAGYDQVHLVGRELSALFDLLTVFFVFLIGSRLYNRRVGILAAAFSALAVLQIQLSHFFVVDTFTAFFTTAAIYIAIRIMGDARTALAGAEADPLDEAEGQANRIAVVIPSALLFVLFGVALGMAVASKINAAVVAALLPLAVVIYLSRVPREKWGDSIYIAVTYMAMAAVVSLLVFRLLQPYAFSGPGFFGISLNPEWTQSLQALSRQSTGSTDTPPELQWTNRPIWFGWVNMVAWGMGWPLGILAWAGFLWMGWRIFRGEWREHLLIWLWTGLYFAWQSLSFTKTMRYDLLIYPTLEVMAAWAVIRLWDTGRAWAGSARKKGFHTGRWLKSAAAVLGALALVASAAWAVAFTRIYTRTNDWMAATQWIYQNVPGAIELPIQTATGTVNQQLPFRNSVLATSSSPFTQAFWPDYSGLVTSVTLPHVLGVQGPADGIPLTVTLWPAGDATGQTVSGTLTSAFTAQDDSRGAVAQIALAQPFPVKAGQQYLLQVQAGGSGEAISAVYLSGVIELSVQSNGRLAYQPLPELKATIQTGPGYTDTFTAAESGTLQVVNLPHVLDLSGAAGEKTLRLTLTPVKGVTPGEGDTTNGASGTVRATFGSGPDNVYRNGQAYQVKLDKPFPLIKGATYWFTIALEQGQGEIALYGSAPALESSWDVPLPYPNPAFPSAYDQNSSIYQADLTYEAYNSDDPHAVSAPRSTKLHQLLTVLDQADYIFIPSNRQYGSITRVPQRYPLTSAYYRELIGCSTGQNIAACYANAQPGTSQGRLGFELVQVFQSNPGLGPLQINDQGAEEAFTVYDHPKVLIFKKTAAYSQQAVADILGAVDTSHVVHLLPSGEIASSAAQANAPVVSAPAAQPTAQPTPQKSLMLPADRLAADQKGGTWSDLFSRADLQNRFPGVGMALWYLAISLLGWVTYPIVRLALPGLSDRGFPLARMAGLLLLALIVWLAGSYQVPFTRATIAVAAAAIALVGLGFAWVQRVDLAREWREHKNVFIWVEIIALSFFAIDLLVRLGNPDLWHQNYGGEKPMDFSFFNAVIKTTSFPPYDPWFSGGYINYYYYGFVIFGVPVKALGIIPAIAYNLILPTVFSLLALGAFSAGWNLMNGLRPKPIPDMDDIEDEPHRGFPGWFHRATALLFERPFWVGLASAIGFLVLGNLGTVRMIWYGIQKLAAPNGNLDGATILQHWTWTFQGLPRWLSGAPLPYYPGDWYWIPSRVVIPASGNEITEFPAFTMLYADPHAHLFALPITLLVIAWGLSVVLACARWGEADGRHRWLSLGASFVLGAAAIGALRPTNTWDFYTYTLFASVALLFAIYRYYQPGPIARRWLPDWMAKLLFAIGALAALVALSILLYQPFNQWFAQGYTSVIPWTGNKTPFWSYVTHWGLFLFVIISWMAWETRDWMATTPMSALRRLKPYEAFIDGAAILVAGAVVMLLFRGIQIAWLALPVAVWAGVLMLRPNLPDSKRFVLFMVGTALLLTLVVELVVVKGDINRQNTIFKFYMQAWTLFALSAGAGLGWLIQALPEWHPDFRFSWSTALVALVFGAALFPVLAGRAKIQDRISPTAPHTLDGMAFMQSAYFNYGPDGGESRNMNLDEDYNAIVWMQENIKGSPVIVEAHTPEYRWGNRFSMFTGLPGVVGYQWHEQQQRSFSGIDPVSPRVYDIASFYTTPDVQSAVDFLKTYNVRYIIVGELEETFYPADGLAKFAAQDGVLWKQVYHQANTSIYEVLPQTLASAR